MANWSNEGLVTGKKIPEDVVKIVYIWAGRELDIKMMNYKQSWGRGVIETGSELTVVRSTMKVFEIETRQVLLLREPVSLMGQCVYIKGWKD